MSVVVVDGFCFGLLCLGWVRCCCVGVRVMCVCCIFMCV